MSAPTGWIIGASSGIGAALARTWHAQGWQLVLSARRAEALQQLNNELGGRHTVLPFDVADAAACRQAVAQLAGRSLDSTVFLAALYQPMALHQLDLAQTEKMIGANILGAFNLVASLLPHLRAQGRGQLALCGSVAGYCGLPGGQPYSATKAAIINLAESLRAEQAAAGLDIRLICPGFVHTPMTAKNNFAMPMAISAAQAGQAIARGLAGRAFEIHFPRRFTWLLKVLRLLPYPLYFALARQLRR